MSVFSADDSLGRMPAGKVAEYLTDIGNFNDAVYFQEGAVTGQSYLRPNKAWAHSGCILGYIMEAKTIQAHSDIVGTSQIVGEKSLIGKQIKISLDKFYTHSYPGFGQHTILCEFSGKNQVPGETEELRFALRCKSNDQASAAVASTPIFMGVTVSPGGISFEGRTINISSSGDESLLSAFDTPAFKSGLSLLTSAQPALKPFSALAISAVKTIAERRKNVQVHQFDLGLDFSDSSTGLRLKTGSYIMVQSDDAAGWSWNDYQWNRSSHTLELKADKSQSIPFNYMVIGVSEF